MKKIKWLHVSDIHLNKKGVETRRIRTKLLEYLTNNHIMCDYVFFTGDLRFAPDGVFSEDTYAFLKGLCESVHASLQNLFIVPGNHDIDRDNAVRMEAIKNICEESEGYRYKDGIIKPEDLKKISSGKEDFIKVIEKVYEKYPSRIELYKNDIEPHFLVKTEDFNILHVDTTIIYAKDRERDLIIGTDLLLDLCEQLDQTKPTILLTHYSFDSIHRNEQKTLIKLL